MTRTALEAQLAALPTRAADKPAGPPAAAADPEQQRLLAALSRLTRTARDAAPRLPPYDQRANALALQRLRARLDGGGGGGGTGTAHGDATAAAAAPAARPRFAFRGQNVRGRSAAAAGADRRAAAGVRGSVPAPPAESTPAPDDADAAAAAAPDPPLELTNLISTPHLVFPPALATTAPSRPRTLILTQLSAAAIDLRAAGPLSSASVRAGARALVVLPRVRGAVRVAGLHRTVVLFAGPAAQLRVHDCADCDFYVSPYGGGAPPVVEGVRRVRFAPAPAGGALRGSGDDHGEEVEGRRWADVQDFEWRKGTQSPNWSIVPEDQRLGPEVWDLFRDGAETEMLLRAVGLGDEADGSE
jgi:hypothetical protein